MPMTANGSGFRDFLREETEKYRGVAMPLRAGLLRCALIREVSAKKLHPNPDNGFCLTNVGPNEGIIAAYEQRIREMQGRGRHCFFDDPLTVQRMYPEGYMILKGHHRWAAAIRAGLRTVPVRVVDLTRAEDIRRMVLKARNSKRVVFDLDEVVFREESEGAVEKALPTPLNRLYPHRLRLGIPALFHDLSLMGYDVWVYTASYWSAEYVRHLFRLYHTRVAGIVTGTSRKGHGDAESRESLEALIANKYPLTVHIDSGTVLSVAGASKRFEEFPLSGSARTWSKEILEVLRKAESQNHTGKNIPIKPDEEEKQ